MSLVLLGASVALLAYAAAIVLLTALTGPLLLQGRRLSDPAARARRLVALRLLPAAGAFLLVGGLIAPAFFWFEPRDASETVSGAMAALAGVGLVLLLAGPARAMLSLLATRRLSKRWDRGALSLDVPGIALPAFVVDEPFPIVSLVGWFRPRLMIARTVLLSCDGDELAAVLAHEAGHHERRDPWVRLLVRGCPDLLSMTPWADRMERLWAEAAEQDADERAARAGPTRALDLASALVKVARLAGAGRPPEPALSALYRGEGVGARVARLLEREGSGERYPARPGRLVAVIGCLALLAFLSLAAASDLHYQVHGVLEAVVALFQ